MARIRTLKLANFKGVTARDELSGKDLFLGANGTGKTARLQALKVGILGYDPDVGAKPAATFSLATA